MEKIDTDYIRLHTTNFLPDYLPSITSATKTQLPRADIDPEQGGGGRGILTCNADVFSLCDSSFFTKIRRGGGVPRAPPLDPPVDTRNIFPDRLKVSDPKAIGTCLENLPATGLRLCIAKFVTRCRIWIANGIVRRNTQNQSYIRKFCALCIGSFFFQINKDRRFCSDSSSHLQVLEAKARHFCSLLPHLCKVLATSPSFCRRHIQSNTCSRGWSKEKEIIGKSSSQSRF